MQNSYFISKSKLRSFGILIGILFPLIIGLIVPLIFGHNFREWTLFIGIPLFILGLISPNLLLWPYKKWMQFGNILGWINSSIILGLVFVLALQPISLFMRLLGHDPLRRKLNNQDSYKELKENYQIDLNRIF